MHPYTRSMRLLMLSLVYEYVCLRVSAYRAVDRVARDKFLRSHVSGEILSASHVRSSDNKAPPLLYREIAPRRSQLFRPDRANPIVARVHPQTPHPSTSPLSPGARPPSYSPRRQPMQKLLWRAGYIEGPEACNLSQAWEEC